MSNNDEMAKVHQEIATHNSELALKKSEKTQVELTRVIDEMNNKIHALTFQVQHLEQKYNLLLTERFDGRATERAQ